MKRKIFAEIVPVEMLCNKCKLRVGKPEHSCPFLSELYGDDEQLCNCCDFCEEKCHNEV